MIYDLFAKDTTLIMLNSLIKYYKPNKAWLNMVNSYLGTKFKPKYENYFAAVDQINRQIEERENEIRTQEKLKFKNLCDQFKQKTK